MLLPFMLPFMLLALSSSFLVRVGSSGSCRSAITVSGMAQKKMAPSEPTVMMVLWSGEIFTLMMDPECPSP